MQQIIESDVEINMQQIIESDVERDYRVSSIIKGNLTGAELLNNIEMYCHRTGAKFGKTLVMHRCVKYFISIDKLSKTSLNTSYAIMIGFQRLSFQSCFWSPYLYSKE